MKKQILLCALLIIIDFGKIASIEVRRVSLPIFPSPFDLSPLKLMKNTFSFKHFGKDRLCGGYDQFKKCSFCFYSYFSFELKQCKQPRSKINNCLFYLDEEYCLDCESGFRLDILSGKCKPIEMENCKSHMNGRCFVSTNQLIDSPASPGNW